MSSVYQIIKRLLLILKISCVYLIVLPTYCFSSFSVRADTAIETRYVRIELPGENRTLSLSEVELVSNNKNIALSGFAKQSSDFNNAVAARAVDGNTSGHFFNKSVTSTQPEADPWWELDLGKDKPVQKMLIYNRTDCCMERINPARIIFYNSDRVIVWQSDIRSDLPLYVFDTQATGPIMGNNLLANAAFQQTSHPLLPDYWDLHHAAALGLKDLYGVYAIDPDEPSPVKGAAVVKIINNNKKFHDVILMSTRQHRKLSDGKYTFSVYAKSSKPDMILNVTSGWAIGKPQPFRLTPAWKRYKVSFDLHGQDVVNLQPVLFFPNAGEYFVSAPQLEYGSQATEFNTTRPYKEDDVLFSLKTQARVFMNKAGNILGNSQLEVAPFLFEYDYYTNEKYANINLRSPQYTHSQAGVRCYAAGKTLQDKAMLDTGILPVVDVIALPIMDLPVGHYECDVYKTVKNDKGSKLTTVMFRKLPVSPFEVKLNNVAKTVLVNAKPFFVTGIAVGYKRDLPDWYLEDIRNRGINTVFINFIPDASGGYDVSAIKILLAKIASYKLHAIVGLPLMGAKPKDWQQKLSTFLDLVQALRDNETIIGWYPVDEPAANTWSDQELQSIYSRVKRLDPYRLVFLNWAYDGIPENPATEPRGGLESTDMYSFDYYPFTGKRMSLEGYGKILERVQNLAQSRNKIAHSWIQIFGGNDAWREPTPAELRYMVYLNLVYGSMFSYWDTKSNSAAVWDEVARLNKEADMLAQNVFLNPESRRLASSITETGVVYSIWKAGKKLYVIMVNTIPGNQKLEINLSPYIPVFSEPYIVHVYPDDHLVPIDNGIFLDAVQQYTGQYFTIDISF